LRPKKPYVASLDQVNISREGDHAIIEYKEPNVISVNLVIGPEVHDMDDRRILHLHNSHILAQQEMARAYKHVAVEIPEGKPQIEHFEKGSQWVPRGDVLKCVISDGGPDGEATVFVDDRELSLAEFGGLLGTFAGWGMRITFVPDDRIHETPVSEIRDPSDGREPGN
jgi:hypothetical protein